MAEWIWGENATWVDRAFYNLPRGWSLLRDRSRLEAGDMGFWSQL